MGEQRNLTEENVDELKVHLKRMQETNPDLEYHFFEQEEVKDESRMEKESKDKTE